MQKSTCFQQAAWKFIIPHRYHVSSFCNIPNLKDFKTDGKDQGFTPCDTFWNVNLKGTKSLNYKKSTKPFGNDLLTKVCSDDIVLHILWLDLMLIDLE